MIFLSDYYCASMLPESLAGVADLMRKANNVLLPKNSDIDRLMEVLADRLKRDRHPKSTACLRLHRTTGNTNGAIYLYAKEHEENSVVRLYFHKVRQVLEYDSEAGDFFDIGERFAELSREGGAE